MAYENMARYLFEGAEESPWEEATEEQKDLYRTKAEGIYNALSAL